MSRSRRERPWPELELDIDLRMVCVGVGAACSRVTCEDTEGAEGASLSSSRNWAISERSTEEIESLGPWRIRLRDTLMSSTFSSSLRLSGSGECMEMSSSDSRVRSAASSSAIRGWKTGDRSRCRATGTERELVDEYERIEREESYGVALVEWDREGALLPLALITESRCEYVDTDASDIFDARRERAAVINMSVSCSVIGDGPGTGGRGDEGGAEGGDLSCCGEGAGE